MGHGTRETETSAPASSEPWPSPIGTGVERASVGSNPSRDYPAIRVLSRSFLTFSFGLLVAPSSQRSTCSTVTVCLTTGSWTDTSSLDARPGVSSHGDRRIAARASAAASKTLSAVTSTACRTPRTSIRVTVQVLLARVAHSPFHSLPTAAKDFRERRPDLDEFHPFRSPRN